MKKKIIYIVLLVLVIMGIIAFFAIQGLDKRETIQNTQTDLNSSVSSQKTKVEEESQVQEETKKEVLETYKTELEDGTLYSLTNEKIKSDVVLGDNYFDTQINDINTNPGIYSGKTIEIEGMYIVDLPYTYVGRYSTSSLCLYCPTNYSCMEYMWDGEEIELKDEDSWIKVVGTLEKLNDETTYFRDYYYIKAQSIEVMKESGQKTVNN